MTIFGRENPLDALEMYPPSFPVEIALRVAPIRKICEAYDISRDDFEIIRHSPVFIADLKRAVEAVRKDGASFRLKAQLQSDELLKTSWKMIHDPIGTPASVRADLIKFTVRAAGLDGSREAAGAAAVGLSIQINL